MAYRFGFNGQEKDDEVAGVGNTMTAEFWEYDARLGRRWNIDPIVKENESGYSTFSSNPIVFIDPNGDNAGDYYSKSGEHLGSDGKADNKGYVTEKDKIVYKGDGKTIDSKKTEKELFTKNHKEFQNTASLIKHESGASGTESSAKWMAHTLNNALGNSDVNYKGIKSLNKLMKSHFSSASNAEKSKLLSVNDNSLHANWARAGLIDVLLGNEDPTGGAVLWDGIDFLKRGFSHPKFSQYSTVVIAENVLNRYIKDAVNLHHLVNPKWTLNESFNVSNLGSKDKFFCEGLWQGNGSKSAQFNLRARGSAGATIFWGISK